MLHRLSTLLSHSPNTTLERNINVHMEPFLLKFNFQRILFHFAFTYIPILAHSLCSTFKTAWHQNNSGCLAWQDLNYLFPFLRGSCYNLSLLFNSDGSSTSASPYAEILQHTSNPFSYTHQVS